VFKTISRMKRRKVIKNLALGAGGIATLTQACTPSQEVAKAPLPEMKIIEKEKPTIYKGNINHSVCRWCYGSIPMEAFIDGVKEMGGIKSIELTTAEEWPLLQKNP